MESQRRVQPQPLECRLTCRRTARSPGEGASGFNENKRWAVETQVALRHRAQESRTHRVESVPRVEGGNPDTGVQCQHGSARFQSSAIC